MGNIFPPSFQETDIKCSCVKGVNVTQQSHQVHCRLPKPATHAQGDGRLQTTVVGNRPSWARNVGLHPLVLLGTRSLNTALTALFPLKFDFPKSLMDDGPCLASPLSWLGTLWTGNKGFPAIAFPPVWIKRKKLLWTPRREARYIRGHNHCYN